MIKYVPKKEKSSSWFSLLLLVCGLTLFGLSEYLSIAPYITQIISIALIVFAIQVMQRYVLSDFTYIIDDRDDGEAIVNVLRTQGKKTTTVCSVELGKCTHFGDADKVTQKINNRFDYRQNLFSNDKFALVYSDVGENILIRLEADDEFKNAVSARAVK